MKQTYEVVERLRKQWPDLEIAIEQIRTTGDRVTNVPLSQIGGDGVFVTEIEHALQERRIDLAVHSLKDLPSMQPEGLRLLILGPREDVRDVLVANETIQAQVQSGLAPQNLPTPLRIGTCSLRRIAQIRALWPDVQILPLRGNVDTRLRKLEAGDYDGIVSAAAGLHRLDMQQRLAGRLSYFSVEKLLPAPGQGAIALECRNEPEIGELLAPLNDPIVQATTTAERMFMRRLGAWCYLPVAAYADVRDGKLILRGMVASLDGQRRVSVAQEMAWTAAAGLERAEQFGVSLAEQALAQGADTIISEVDTKSMAQEYQSV
ncbi:hydroxymethylbilane synthase [Ktedonosporobacter rubrisoli]|nr:hydroxymethylbilane synthase [Ktedonosporobacter rubrisoli]